MILLGLSNVPTVFMELVNQVLCEYLDHFIMVFIDYILVYPPSEEEYTEHLTLMITNRLHRFNERTNS